MFQIKNLNVLNLDKTLIEICNDVALLGFDIITSAFRPGDAGVHGTLRVRAVDFRCHDDEKGNRTEDYINSKWIYDPMRPQMRVAIYHDVGQGKHLHLQVHPNTMRKD